MKCMLYIYATFSYTIHSNAERDVSTACGCLMARVPQKRTYEALFTPCYYSIEKNKIRVTVCAIFVVQLSIST